MRSIFVNLPVKDVKASKAFFEAVGFTFNPMFSSDDTASLIIEENIHLMLLEHPRFGDFITGEISQLGTEVITCLSADSRSDVEATLEKALAAGAKPWKPAQELGFMYGISFQDLDGHVWEVMWMDPTAAAEGPPEHGAGA